jgi:hypothetical protein
MNIKDLIVRMVNNANKELRFGNLTFLPLRLKGNKNHKENRSETLRPSALVAIF